MTTKKTKKQESIFRKNISKKNNNYRKQILCNKKRTINRRGSFKHRTSQIPKESMYHAETRLTAQLST